MTVLCDEAPEPAIMDLTGTRRSAPLHFLFRKTATGVSAGERRGMSVCLVGKY